MVVYILFIRKKIKEEKNYKSPKCEGCDNLIYSSVAKDEKGCNLTIIQIALEKMRRTFVINKILFFLCLYILFYIYMCSFYIL
jgi:hypothetical protein